MKGVDVARQIAPAARWPGWLHRLYMTLVTGLRSSRVIYRMIFGHWPAPEVKGQLWDWTTLALGAALRRHVRTGSSLVDIGTGPTGVLAIYAKNRLGADRVCGVDHFPEFLATAAATARAIDLNVEFRCSQLFDSVTGRFDVIVFNAPYIPAGPAQRLRISRHSGLEQRWSGGATGLETIERFLDESGSHLTEDGLILLGVNHFYVTPEAIRSAIVRHGLEEMGTVARRLSRACVYVLRPAGSQRLRASMTPPDTSATSMSTGA